MKLLLFVCAAVGLFNGMALTAKAAVVADPKNIFSQVDQFLGPQVFESSLACPHHAVFFYPIIKAELSCDDSGCGISAEEKSENLQNADVADCNATSVTINYDDGRTWVISKNDFQSANGNMAKLFLQNLGDYLGYPGQVTIDAVAPASYTLASGQVLKAQNVTGFFKMDGASDSFDVLVTVVQATPGVVQMARLRIGSETFFRLKEF